MNNGLTEGQHRVLKAIADWRLEHSYPPTVRDVARAIQRTSSPVEMHIQALIAKGYLTRQPTQSRSMVLTKQGQKAVR